MSIADGSPHISDFPVVGIGASAGGIRTLRNLLAALPRKSGLALVVVQHLPPNVPSRLVGILARAAKLTVREVVDGTTLQRDCVYVAAPDQVVTLEKGTLRSQTLSGFGRPGIDTIDTLLESLAADRGKQAIAVILSGTGTDGAAGAICVKRAGGTVLVQKPTTAEYGGMPLAAIATGTADHVLALRSIARELAARASPSYVPPPSKSDWNEEDAQALDDILTLIRRSVGFDLTGYKRTPLIWKTQERMRVRHIEDFRDYQALLEDDPAEREAFVHDVPIYVTSFFRDAEAWEVLDREVMPSLVAEGRPIRAWTPACSTGEEAYSVAMLLAEHAGRVANPAEFQVFATDASAEIVARAGRGRFSANAVKRVSPERTEQFFYSADGKYCVKKSLREKMVFAVQDLLADPPFSDLDLITCRNLLIYLEPSAIERVLSLLHSALRMKGYLFLGQGESLPPKQRGFEAVSFPSPIYRKVGAAKSVAVSLPGPESTRRPASNRALVAESAHRAVIEEFDIPSVLIDQEFNILRVYGDTDAFLRLPPGPPTHNLLDVVQSAWVTDVRIAIEHAMGVRRTITVADLTYNGPTSPAASIRVTPLHGEDERTSTRLLVSFLRPMPSLEATLADGRGNMPSVAIFPDGGTQDSADALRMSVEELEASREELQALNEELRTVNEQLMFSHEEVIAVNAELREKIQELETQANVLASGAVMTLFLDGELRVRWFTPAVTELFPLLPTDIGRPITIFAQKYVDEQFVSEVQAVMRTGEPAEAEVRSVEGRWYLRRIRPFRGEESNTGVAITFSDITDRKRAEESLRSSEAWLAGQKEAFQAAINGAPLETSLGVLVRTAMEQAGTDVRCAFYIADAEKAELRHVVGMPEAYAECVDGFRIGPDSLACGLAVYTGQPVITPDVTKAPRWKPWLWLAERYDYRGCWSFPIETESGNVVGTFAMYFTSPREATPRDCEFASVLTRAAAIIISRTQQAEQCARAEEALRESKQRL